MFDVPLLGLVLLGGSGCETYELPPRLRGGGTDACPTCDVFELEESRLPVGGVATITSRIVVEDEWGSISNIRAFVTTPSGDVVEESYTVLVEVEREVEVDTDDPSTTVVVVEEQERFRPGFTCAFRAEAVSVRARNCDLDFERDSTVGAVALVLSGVEQGELSIGLGVELTEVGEWTVAVEAERSTGVRSNRLSTTFDVVADVGEGDESGG